jgi:phospholipid/cholesterol/gamma-HCH transport system ATP-binding protein
MIAIQNISKSFGDRVILENVSGVFEQGKTNLIIGASGTGKSVLLKCIVGLVMPDQGDVLFGGKEFSRGDIETKREIRRQIGMLFQGSALFDSLNVEQNVMFPLQMLHSHMPKSEMMDRVNECLRRVALEGSNQKMPSELSGGMKKRVGIARAIVLNPKYLFCDEPNSGLDPQTSIRIDNLIHEITKEYNTTTVVVTHDMNSVVSIGEYIMFLYKGHKLWEGNHQNILGANVEELNNFIYANKLMKEAKEKLIAGQ